MPGARLKFGPILVLYFFCLYPALAGSCPVGEFVLELWPVFLDEGNPGLSLDVKHDHRAYRVAS